MYEAKATKMLVKREYLSVHPNKECLVWMHVDGGVVPWQALARPLVIWECL